MVVLLHKIAKDVLKYAMTKALPWQTGSYLPKGMPCIIHQQDHESSTVHLSYGMLYFLPVDSMTSFS